MTKFLQLTIARVDQPVFVGEVASVTLPGTEGEMTLLANHTPLITALRAGTLIYRLPDGTEESHLIERGTLEIRDNHATILI